MTTTPRSEILRGQYRPGERLPSERDLAARFEANRGPVRASPLTLRASSHFQVNSLLLLVGPWPAHLSTKLSSR
ncbi:MAG: GntR family transcriptional regulator [Proteobacteria bacterium]|nr:GntR family transcriptional regulator [Pseudomonadota bacterium]